MSRNIRAITRLTAEVRQAMSAHLCLLGDSASLCETAGAVANGVTMEAMTDLLNQPGLDELAASSAILVDQLGAARSQLTESGSVLDVHAAATLLDALAEELAVRERYAVADIAVAVLTEMGAHVRRADGADVGGIEAFFGDQTLMLLAVENGGGVLSDQADAAGTCAQRQADFEDRMRRRGAVLTRIAEDAHDRRRGPLIAAAARIDAANLAEAIADHTHSSSRGRHHRASTGAARTVQAEAVSQ